MELGIIILYTICLSVIFVYSLVQWSLIRSYRRSHKHTELIKNPEIEIDKYPLVTIQLPIFNEKYVAERLLDAVAKIDYPKDKLEIQVLDDSNDETAKILFSQVEQLESNGLNIVYHHRSNRKGFKAGALKDGLSFSSGEYVAIFDADFIPRPDFLKATIPYFADDKIGMVQTRWGHLNKEYSLLTKLQAFGLNAHFTVEQKGRNASDYFINFNGTAGIWRKSCILDAGNWHADTLTEDLDLSYRAQMKGWKFKYLEDVESPAELPVEINAFKSQQFRWTKGAAETAKKTIPEVLKSGMRLDQKIHSFFHLLNSTVFICVLISAILSIPMLWIKHNNPEFKYYFHFASLFLISLLILGIMYWETLRIDHTSRKKKLKVFFAQFPVFLSVMMGLSLHNSLAAIEGLLGIKSPFIRTPKFNIIGNSSINKNEYIKANFSLLTVLEIMMVIYFIFGIYLGISLEDYALIFYHLMLVIGFGLIIFYTFYHSNAFRKA